MINQQIDMKVYWGWYEKNRIDPTESLDQREAGQLIPLIETQSLAVKVNSLH